VPLNDKIHGRRGCPARRSRWGARPATHHCSCPVDRLRALHEPRQRPCQTTTPGTRNNTQRNSDGHSVAFVLLVLDLGSRRRRRVLSSAASFGVELVFLALVDGVGAITSAVGGGVTEAECDDDDGNDPQGVNGEADQPENQCGAQDDQHHLAEACPLAEQERDPLGQPAPFGCLAGAACRLGGRCWECSLR
jgi:hypothetical protein